MRSEFLVLLVLASIGVGSCDYLDVYRERISFIVFSASHPNGTRSSLEDTPESLGCDANKNFTFVTHGWMESIERLWSRPMVREFLKVRGNCVFFMDYHNYSRLWYFDLTPHFNAISALLTEKVSKVVKGKHKRVAMFGFSFGARLVIDTGVTLYKRGLFVERIFACDPAGPGFGGYTENAMIAADHVQCIHSSNNYGTTYYNCHQNWRLGYCGWSQPGARSFPYGSHGLCPYLFLASFKTDFIQNNFNNCTSDRLATDIPSDLMMGPRESRIEHYGDIFVATARNPPWIVVNGVVNNAYENFPPASFDTRSGIAQSKYAEQEHDYTEVLANEV